MAVFVATSPSAAASPSYGVEGAMLWARTAWVWHFLSLGGWCRTVTLQGDFVSIEDRSLWLRTTHRIVPLEQVSHIDYRFADSGAAGSIFSRDSIERFSVALVLTKEHRGEQIHLFDFWGKEHHPGLVGAVEVSRRLTQRHAELVTTRGTQEADSVGFVDLLRDFTGLGIGDPQEHLDAAMTRTCPKCQRRNGAATDHCLYCASPLG